MIEGAIETPTFKKIGHRWHIAQKCMTCRALIWRDVHDKPLTSATPPYCDACQSAAGVTLGKRAS